ncbi:ESX-1 secretion system protein EccD1 [Mycobacterium simulans]|uniref:ESX-1 secretion system protein EccD1 n=1 Tax=Mycobacterium simulans TaxID=627089 RepID=A0A7Z7IPV6_9MYCO|nr:type VII secretion integral membrane protein EccD [Mycobacterium simulans]SOJ57632.1 ESX-1 secretion system protein EccD1 [Mycobacterium simulans]
MTAVVFPSQELAPADGTATLVPEQVRVVVHVGTWLVEVSLTAHTPIALVMEDLIPFLFAALADQGLDVTSPASAMYSLAFEGGAPFATSQTLADVGVVDGTRVVLREVHSKEVFKPLVEDVADALAEFNAAKFAVFTADTARMLALTSIFMFAALAASLVVLAWFSTSTWRWWLPPSAAAVALLIVGAVVAVTRRRSADQISYVLGAAALPLAFSAGWVLVPPHDGGDGGWTAANLLAGSVALGTTSFVVAYLTKIGPAFHTATTLSACFAAGAAAAFTFTGLGARQVGTTAVVLGMILITAAPRISLLLARIQPPLLPAPGQSIDRRVLDEAATMVEVGDSEETIALSNIDDTLLERKSHLANKYLTGIFFSAVVSITVGGVAAIKPNEHYFYGELSIALLAVLSLLLRGRTLIDRVQAIAFFCGAFVLTAGLAVTVALGLPTPAVLLALLGFVAVIGVCAALSGLFLVDARLPPIRLRRIEQIEFMCIFSIAPIAFWVIGIYAWVQHR